MIHGWLRLNLVCRVVICVGDVPTLVTMIVMLFGRTCSTVNISIETLNSVVVNSSKCRTKNCTMFFPLTFMLLFAVLLVGRVAYGWVCCGTIFVLCLIDGPWDHPAQATC